MLWNEVGITLAQDGVKLRAIASNPFHRAKSEEFACKFAGSLLKLSPLEQSLRESESEPEQLSKQFIPAYKVVKKEVCYSTVIKRDAHYAKTRWGQGMRCNDPGVEPVRAVEITVFGKSGSILR
jgi:hypothetical protein